MMASSERTERLSTCTGMHGGARTSQHTRRTNILLSAASFIALGTTQPAAAAAAHSAPPETMSIWILRCYPTEQFASVAPAVADARSAFSGIWRAWVAYWLLGRWHLQRREGTHLRFVPVITGSSEIITICAGRETFMGFSLNTKSTMVFCSYYFPDQFYYNHHSLFVEDPLLEIHDS